MAIDPEKSEDPLGRVQVAVFAKAPVPGLAKTRLIPALGERGAARLQRKLTRMALRTADAARLGPVTLWCAPSVNHRFFRALRRTSGTSCMAQPEGDLGHRMDHAFSYHCISGPLLLIGTDCPSLQPEHLRRAAQALGEGADAVFFPAEDGGYVLVGLRRPVPQLFTGMRWSTCDVMAATRRRAHEHGLHVREFETLWDVDETSDLERLHEFLGKYIA